MNKSDTPELLRLRAKLLRLTLPDVCREAGLSARRTLVVAGHLVHDEDVKGGEPSACVPAVEHAKRLHRLERRIKEPDWPESAKRKYQEQHADFRKAIAQFGCSLEPHTSHAKDEDIDD
jgi:hypothetical protein